MILLSLLVMILWLHKTLQQEVGQKSLMVTGCFTLGTTVTEVHIDPSFAPGQSHIRNYVLVNLNPK